MVEDIKRRVVAGNSSLELKNAAIRDHEMITLRRCGILNAMRGITSMEEVLRITMPDEVQTAQPAAKKAKLKPASTGGR